MWYEVCLFNVQRRKKAFSSIYKRQYSRTATVLNSKSSPQSGPCQYRTENRPTAPFSLIEIRVWQTKVHGLCTADRTAVRRNLRTGPRRNGKRTRFVLEKIPSPPIDGPENRSRQNHPPSVFVIRVINARNSSGRTARAYPWRIMIIVIIMDRCPRTDFGAARGRSRTKDTRKVHGQRANPLPYPDAPPAGVGRGLAEPSADAFRAPSGRFG